MKIISFTLIIFALVQKCDEPPKPSVAGTWISYPDELVSVLEINKKKAIFEFGCANAEINEEVDVNVKKKYSGIFQQGRPVLPENYNPKDDQREALFEFEYDGELLKVKIFDPNPYAGEMGFWYKRGVAKNIPKCL
jgi:hypothetical protein